jgi:hypothetical protein
MGIAGGNQPLEPASRHRPAPLHQTHPVSKDARRDAGLSMELGQGLLTSEPLLDSKSVQPKCGAEKRTRVL